MGAYSSDDLLPAALRETVITTIVEPTLRGLENDGLPYQGFLYIGLMLTPEGLKCWSSIAASATQRPKR